ncbi:MAG: adenylate/guanylate cyclase domain-containing protein [Xanthobacteraceae bacterium]
MDDAQFAELAGWISGAGLGGQDETTIVTELCTRLVAHGVPLARAQVFIDTLHPIHGGRSYFWQAAKGETIATEYGQVIEGAALARWRKSVFYRLLETGDSTLRRRLTKEGSTEFPFLGELYASGMTDYLAVIDRFGVDAIIGEMDCLYSSWVSDAPQGFTDVQIAALRRLTPGLALAVKSATLVRIAKTLVETYLGRDPGKRILKGSIARGSSTSIDAVLWFSDLHDYTRICDRVQPHEIIPLLNDYADTVISAIHEEGGDVLKLIGDGTLAMFTGEDRHSACRAALAAARKTLERIDELKQRRLAGGLPATDVYLGLHPGEVVYGNFGSRERLDFTVVGPAVNEVSRIAAMCRLVDQPILVSSDFFAAVGAEQNQLVSVGRYALRGVGQPQSLFTLDWTR